MRKGFNLGAEHFEEAFGTGGADTAFVHGMGVVEDGVSDDAPMEAEEAVVHKVHGDGGSVFVEQVGHAAVSVGHDTGAVDCGSEEVDDGIDLVDAIEPTMANFNMTISS